jgi:hypothetical protein
MPLEHTTTSQFLTKKKKKREKVDFEFCLIPLPCETNKHSSLLKPHLLATKFQMPSRERIYCDKRKVHKEKCK